MHRLLAFVLLTAPVVAHAKKSSGGVSSSPEATIFGIIAAVVIFALMFAMASARSKTTISRPDGTTTELSDSSESTPASTAPKKQMVGPTTMEFPSTAARSAGVQYLKQEYGTAIRIVHRGSIEKRDGWGIKKVYTIVMEVPVKCPECGETYSVEDFGLTDCPTCSAALAVYFDKSTRKRGVGIARDGKIYEPEKKKRTNRAQSTPRLAPSEQEIDRPDQTAEEARESRFTKVG